jgi:hypothetical protein
MWLAEHHFSTYGYLGIVDIRAIRRGPRWAGTAATAT